MALTPIDLKNSFDSFSAKELDEPDAYERINGLCDDVLKLERPADAFPYLFEFIERFHEEDLGSPGPLVHTMEKFVGSYEEHLEASIIRLPTVLSLWMINRILNGSAEELNRWMPLVHTALTRDDVTVEAQSEALGIIGRHE